MKQDDLIQQLINLGFVWGVAKPLSFISVPGLVWFYKIENYYKFTVHTYENDIIKIMVRVAGSEYITVDSNIPISDLLVLYG